MLDSNIYLFHIDKIEYRIFKLNKHSLQTSIGQSLNNTYFCHPSDQLQRQYLIVFVFPLPQGLLYIPDTYTVNIQAGILQPRPTRGNLP